MRGTAQSGNGVWEWTVSSAGKSTVLAQHLFAAFVIATINCYSKHLSTHSNRIASVCRRHNRQQQQRPHHWSLLTNNQRQPDKGHNQTQSKAKPKQWRILIVVHVLIWKDKKRIQSLKTTTKATIRTEILHSIEGISWIFGMFGNLKWINGKR